MPRIAGSSLSEVHLGTEEAPDPVELDPDRPFRILIAGDFSGRSWRDDSPKSFRPQLVDRDNFDEVLAGLKVSVDLHGVTLSFREIEDFHPDRIFQSVPAFANLDDLLDQPPAAASAAAASSHRPASAGGLLDAMIGEQSDEPSPPVSAEDAGDLAAFIRRSLAGHVAPAQSPARQQRAARRDAMVSELLRGLLHHPRMQAIEAAWRALYMLVRALDTDGALKVYILDISLPELVADLDKIRTQLAKTKPWGLIAGNYIFGQSEIDAEVLRRLAAIASSLGAPFVAEADPPKADEVEAWQKLRQSAAARWLGLALPRFLLRLPYGKDTDSTAAISFEEMPESEHNAYLWGNPAFLCAHLVGMSFLDHGWDFGRKLRRRIDGLPMHVYREDGEPVAKPCAEVLMSEREAETLLESGFMPLASLKDQNAALLVRFQSIAQPPAPLAGLS